MAKHRPEKLTRAALEAKLAQWERGDEAEPSHPRGRNTGLGTPDSPSRRDATAGIRGAPAVPAPHEAPHDPYQDADHAFEALMQQSAVRPLGADDKRREPHAADKTPLSCESIARTIVREPLGIDALTAPELTAAQRDLLRRVRRAKWVPQRNLRLLSKTEAMEQLRTFMGEQQRAGTRFVEVITGKGKHSRELPVIKPAVLQWCAIQYDASYVIGYAPRPDQSGNYGAIVIELRAGKRGFA